LRQNSGGTAASTVVFGFLYSPPTFRFEERAEDIAELSGIQGRSNCSCWGPSSAHAYRFFGPCCADEPLASKLRFRTVNQRAWQMGGECRNRNILCRIAAMQMSMAGQFPAM
jgi:hypothetical protein